jgi:predicted ester cyclase
MSATQATAGTTADREAADATANKEIVRAFVAAWNSRDLSRFDELMAETGTLSVGGVTVSCAPSATRAIVEHWTGGFPDYTFELLDLVAEGDRVVARMPWTGTHTGPVLDLAPTGRRVEVDEIVIFRIAGGRIAEAWEVWDEHAMRRQLGAG